MYIFRIFINKTNNVYILYAIYANVTNLKDSLSYTYYIYKICFKNINTKSMFKTQQYTIFQLFTKVCDHVWVIVRWVWSSGSFQSPSFDVRVWFWIKIKVLHTACHLFYFVMSAPLISSLGAQKLSWKGKGLSKSLRSSSICPSKS